MNQVFRTVLFIFVGSLAPTVTAPAQSIDVKQSNDVKLSGDGNPPPSIEYSVLSTLVQAANVKLIFSGTYKVISE